MHVLLIILACGEPHPAEAQHAQHTQPEQAVHVEPAAHAADDHASAGLSLDGDKKWPMDEHTRTVVGEIRGALASAQPQTAADAAALGATVQGQLDRLISGCTMTGPAHDQLHVFLTGFMPAVAELSSATDAAEGVRLVGVLREMVVEYDRYFE